MSETEEVQMEHPKTSMEEANEKLKLDDGAAVVFVGVDECYQNYADPTHMPLNSASEVQALVDNGTLELIEVGDETRVTGNIGILAGQDQVANSDIAPTNAVEAQEAKQAAADEAAKAVEEETEEAHDPDVPTHDRDVPAVELDF